MTTVMRDAARRLPAALSAVLVLGFVAARAGPAQAAGCSFRSQGDGRFKGIVDGRTIQLDDGREVRLAGIEIPDAAIGEAALAALLLGREVMLQGDSDMPDRYGRQPAMVFVDRDRLVQRDLLAQGAALVAATVTDKGCAAELRAAEADARRARRGIWSRGSVIKNAESPGDILAGIGQFSVVEGTVQSVRQAGATTYVNFGRRWTQGFAVTISKRMMSVLEGAGVSPKALERRRIRVRGWIEARGGPRIEVLRVGQIELVGDD
ncbi:thermonuclease family protein [soil metagenome]